MKTCSRCKVDKPDSEFAFKNKAKGTRASECKGCHRQIRNKLYAQSPLPDQTRVRQRRREIQRWMDEYRATKQCPCGESHPGCLDFHHLDPTAKDISVSHVARRGWSRERILKELEKCQILCSNCHRKLHWEQRRKRA